jgi:hypothetical protein
MLLLVVVATTQSLHTQQQVFPYTGNTVYSAQYLLCVEVNTEWPQPSDLLL